MEDHHPRLRPQVQCLVVPFVLDGAMNRDAFEAYVEQLLAPTLSQGDCMILDNLSSHKSDRARELIEARGAKLVFLPPYSPDLKSDRDGDLQVQDPATQSRRAHHAGALGQDR
jgi:hypothetical protein